MAQNQINYWSHSHQRINMVNYAGYNQSSAAINASNQLTR